MGAISNALLLVGLHDALRLLSVYVSASLSLSQLCLHDDSNIFVFYDAWAGGSNGSLLVETYFRRVLGNKHCLGQGLTAFHFDFPLHGAFYPKIWNNLGFRRNFSAITVNASRLTWSANTTFAHAKLQFKCKCLTHISWHKFPRKALYKHT